MRLLSTNRRVSTGKAHDMQHRCNKENLSSRDNGLRDRYTMMKDPQTFNSPTPTPSSHDCPLDKPPHAKRWLGGRRAFEKRLCQRNREFIVRAKSKPCMDCGTQFNPWVMQFDHRDRTVKFFDMSNVRRSSIKKIEAEIAKCDVVCANCHAQRTYDRGTLYGWRNGSGGVGKIIKGDLR